MSQEYAFLFRDSRVKKQGLGRRCEAGRRPTRVRGSQAAGRLWREGGWRAAPAGSVAVTVLELRLATAPLPLRGTASSSRKRNGSSPLGRGRAPPLSGAEGRREELGVVRLGPSSLPGAQLRAARVAIRRSLPVTSSPSCPLASHASLCLSLVVCKMGVAIMPRRDVVGYKQLICVRYLAPACGRLRR